MSPVSNFQMRLRSTIACAGGIVLWWRFGGVVSAALMGVLALLALMSWLSPERYRPVQCGLDFVVRLVAGGFSWVMLGLVYFFVFTPLRLIGQLVGRDPLGLKRSVGTASYLRPVPPAGPDRFKRQF